MKKLKSKAMHLKPCERLIRLCWCIADQSLHSGCQFSNLSFTEYGGLGLDFSYSVAVAEALGAINCGGIPMAIGVQTDMATPALAT